MRRRRIWSEHVPLAELAADRALRDALTHRGIQLVFSVQPPQLEDALTLLARFPGCGLWPLLDDHEGRWLHPGNATAFERWVTELLDAVRARGLGPKTLALDLEPPIDDVRRWTRGEFGTTPKRQAPAGSNEVHGRMITRARAQGLEVIATAIPPAVLPGRAGRGWQHALGTPLGLDYDRVSAMLYTSLFEGYSFGSLNRAASLALLYRFATEGRARFGDRAGLSLGAVGPGALGDERAYRDLDELAEDVALARHAGVDDLSLFDLTGVLGRAQPERWLDVWVNTPAAEAPPPSSKRALTLVGTLMVSGVALDVARSPR